MCYCTHVVASLLNSFTLLFSFGSVVSFSAAVIVLLISAFHFSNAYLHQYPIESVTKNSSFACDVTIRNAKFSTTTQKSWGTRRSNWATQPIVDLLTLQQFTLNIDFVQTAFNCQDSILVQRIINNKYTSLSISNCEKSHNETVLHLAILLPTHEITLQLILPGLKNNRCHSTRPQWTFSSDRKWTVRNEPRRISSYPMAGFFR